MSSAVDWKKRSILFLQSPDEWPCWPVCPVKKYVEGSTAWPVLGYVISGTFDVVEGNIYLFGAGKVDNKTQVHSYESAEDVVDDGWVVD